MKRFSIALVFAALALSVSAQAQSPYGGGQGTPYYGSYGSYGSYGGYPQARPQPPQAEPSPSALVGQGIQALRGFIESGAAFDSPAGAAFLKSKIVPFFDFDYMTKFAIGPAARRMSPAQKQEAGAMVRKNFLTQLTRHVADYSTARIDVGSPMMRGRGEVTVPLRVWRANGQSTDLQFRFYRAKSGWKVFDVSANGQSAIIFYRSYINRMMRG